MSFAKMVPGSYYQNPALQYGPMLPGQDRNAPVPGWGMNPYWAGPRMVGVGGFRGFGADASVEFPGGGASSPIPTWAMVGIGVAVFGLIAAGIYTNFKIASKIAEKEGSAGMLKYELGTAAIGAGAHALNRLMDGDSPRYARNKRRRSRRRARR